MTKLEARFLRATPADAGVLAELVQLASEGLGLRLWTKLAAGGDPWSVGRAHLSSETAGLSYRNAIIAKLGAQPVAGLISYPLGDQAARETNSVAWSDQNSAVNDKAISARFTTASFGSAYKEINEPAAAPLCPFRAGGTTSSTAASALWHFGSSPIALAIAPVDHRVSDFVKWLRCAA